MLRLFTRIATACSVLAVAGSLSPALGQVCCYDPCCCPPPVVQTCYQTIPCTEYRKVKQIVQRPICETKIVEQPCTTYQTVCEPRTAQVPTCTYQPVTEYRTVQRDCGRWVTNYRCRPEVSPCQYDCRPDLFGFINRTGYSLRMAFTPRVWAERTYVPNVVCQQIPVTRHVAVHGTRTVNYQVSRVVPVTTTRKVAINTVRMVPQEIETRQAFTVFRTVPVGTGLAFGGPMAPAFSVNPGAPGDPRSAKFVPTPAELPVRSANANPDGPAVKVVPKGKVPMEHGNDLKNQDSQEDGIDVFKNRSGSINNPGDSKTEPVLPAKYSEEPRAAPASAVSQEVHRVSPGMFVAHSARRPVAKKTAGGWIARRRSVQPAPIVEPNQDVLPAPEVLLTENARLTVKP